MYQPYTAPTLTSTRPATGLHTSPRQSSIHKPIHQRHSPPNLRANTTHKPIHQRHSPHIPHSTNTHTHTASTNTYSLHKNTRPLDASPPTDVDAVDALDVDADAQTLLQHRCSRSPDALAATHRSAIGQARQTGSGHTKPDRTGSGRPFTIEQARHQTGRVQDQTRPD